MNDEFERRVLETLAKESSLFDQLRSSGIHEAVLEIPETFFEELDTVLTRRSARPTDWRSRV